MTRTDTRSVFLLARLMMFVFGATIAVNAVVLKDIGREFVLDYSQLGLLGLVRGVSLASIVVLGGVLGDAYGKKPFLVAGMLLLGVALVCTGATRSYTMLLFAFGCAGIGLGFIEALTNPMVAELGPERVNRNLNELNAFFAIGMVSGAVAGGEALFHGLSWRLPFLGLALLALIGGLSYQRIGGCEPVASKGHEGGIRDLIKSRVFWRLAAAMGLTAGVEAGLAFWGASFIRDCFSASPRAGALGVALFAGFMAAGRFGVCKLTHRIALNRIIIAAAVLGIIGLAGLVLSSAVATSLIFLGICGVAVGPFWPTILALAEERNRIASTTLCFALLAAFGIAGYSLMPLVIGVLADRWGLHVGFSVMILTLILVVPTVTSTPETR